AAAGWRCRPGGRLDMSHGFVRHIRRNQIARDAYERAVRQARGRARGRLTPAPPRPRRPDQQVYRPRRPEGGAAGDTHRSDRAGEHPRVGQGGGWAPEGAMEMGAHLWRGMGSSREMGRHPREVTRRVCARSPLEPALRRALCQRVQDELSKRRGTG
ncbi:CB068 protein, partial [Nycticryphes semicollaris]|nr:CB068 protein [Nycticryphes semicollaris]